MQKSAHKKPLVIYLDSRQAYFFDLNKNAIKGLEFKNNLIDNLEVVDIQAYKEYIADFINKEAYKPGEVIIILAASLYFIENLQAVKEAEKEGFIKHFRATLPFDTSFVKKISYNKQEYIIGLNRELYEHLIIQLRSQEFEVSMLLPYDLIVPFLMEGKINLEAIKRIVAKQDEFILFNFLREKSEKKGLVLEKQESTVESRKKMMILIVIMLFFIALLILIIYYRSNENKKKQLLLEQKKLERLQGREQESALPVTVNLSPTLTIAMPEATTAATIQNHKTKEQIKIKIQNGTGLDNPASTLQSYFQDASYTNLEIITVTKTSAKKTQVIFDSNISSVDKLEVLRILSAANLEYDSLENKLEGYDVIITLVNEITP